MSDGPHPSRPLSTTVPPSSSRRSTGKRGSRERQAPSNSATRERIRPGFIPAYPNPVPRAPHPRSARMSGRPAFRRAAIRGRALLRRVPLGPGIPMGSGCLLGGRLGLDGRAVLGRRLHGLDRGRSRLRGRCLGDGHHGDALHGSHLLGSNRQGHSLDRAAHGGSPLGGGPPRGGPPLGGSGGGTGLTRCALGTISPAPTAPTAAAAALALSGVRGLFRRSGRALRLSSDEGARRLPILALPFLVALLVLGRGGGRGGLDRRGRGGRLGLAALRLLTRGLPLATALFPACIPLALALLAPLLPPLLRLPGLGGHRGVTRRGLLPPPPAPRSGA